MGVVAHGRALWKNLIHRRRAERDLDEEVRAAYDMLVAEKLEAGLTLAETRRAATIELGGIEQAT